MVPIIVRLVPRERQSCQGRNVRKRTVERAGRVPYGAVPSLRSGLGPVFCHGFGYSGTSGEPGRMAIVIARGQGPKVGLGFPYGGNAR
jgi:hypothetical protein